jgi:hypothetical protein
MLETNHSQRRGANLSWQLIPNPLADEEVTWVLRQQREPVWNFQLPGRGPYESRRRPQQRALPSPIPAHQRNPFTLIHSHVDSADDVEVLLITFELHPQPLDIQGGPKLGAGTPRNVLYFSVARTSDDRTRPTRAS